jgi:hypothetical protein
MPNSPARSVKTRSSFPFSQFFDPKELIGPSSLADNILQSGKIEIETHSGRSGRLFHSVLISGGDPWCPCAPFSTPWQDLPRWNGQPATHSIYGRNSQYPQYQWITAAAPEWAE